MGCKHDHTYCNVCARFAKVDICLAAQRGVFGEEGVWQMLSEWNAQLSKQYWSPGMLASFKMANWFWQTRHTCSHPIRYLMIVHVSKKTTIFPVHISNMHKRCRSRTYSTTSMRWLSTLLTGHRTIGAARFEPNGFRPVELLS